MLGLLSPERQVACSWWLGRQYVTFQQWWAADWLPEQVRHSGVDQRHISKAIGLCWGEWRWISVAAAPVRSRAPSWDQQAPLDLRVLCHLLPSLWNFGEYTNCMTGSHSLWNFSHCCHAILGKVDCWTIWLSCSCWKHRCSYQKYQQSSYIVDIPLSSGDREKLEKANVSFHVESSFNCRHPSRCWAWSGNSEASQDAPANPIWTGTLDSPLNLQWQILPLTKCIVGMKKVSDS